MTRKLFEKKGTNLGQYMEAIRKKTGTRVGQYMEAWKKIRDKLWERHGSMTKEEKPGPRYRNTMKIEIKGWNKTWKH